MPWQLGGCCTTLAARVRLCMRVHVWWCEPVFGYILVRYAFVLYLLLHIINLIKYKVVITNRSVCKGMCSLVEYFNKYVFSLTISEHTYIHNWPLQSFSQDYWPSFSHLWCVLILYIKWRGLHFKVGSERQIFWETFHRNFTYSQSFCQKSAVRGNRRKNTFRILYWCLAWLFV